MPDALIDTLDERPFWRDGSGPAWDAARRAEALRLSGRPAAALAEASRAARLEPREAFFPCLRAKIRHDVLLRGRGKGAVSGYRALLADLALAKRLDPGLIWSYMLSAEVKRCLLKPEEGIAELVEAARRAPETGLVWAYLSRLEAFFPERRAAAYEHLTRAVSLDGRGELKSWLGELERKRGNAAEALRLLGEGIAAAPDYDRAYAWRGAALLAAGRTRDALSDLDRAVRLNARYSWTFLERSKARQAAGDTKGALRDLDAAEALEKAFRREHAWQDAVRASLGLSIEPPAHLFGFLYKRRSELLEGPPAARALSRAAALDPGYEDELPAVQEMLALLSRGDAEGARARARARPALARSQGVLAELSHLEGRHAEAASRAAAAARKYPRGAWAHAMLGRCELARGRRAAAAAALRRAVEIHPRYAQAWAWLASALAGAEREDALRRAEALDPRLPEAAVLRGTLASLTAAIDEHGEHCGALLARAALRFEEGDWVEAVRDANRAVLAAPLDRRARLLRHRFVRAFIRACHDREGLDRVVRADPNLVWFYNERFEARCCFGQFDEVLRELEALIRRKPRDARAHALRGELLRMPNFARYDEAVASFRRAVELEPSCSWMRAFLGRGLAFGGDPAAGLEQLARACELDPSCGWTHAWRAEVLHELRRDEEAAAELEKALAADPHCPAALGLRGQVRLRLGDPRGALTDLDDALRLHFRYAEVYIWPDVRGREREDLIRIDLFGLSLERATALRARAEAKRRLGRHAEALDDLERACSLDPKYAEQPWEDEGSFARDVEAAAAALPLSAWARAWRGRLMLSREPAAALKELEEALRLDSSLELPRVWRAEALVGLGRSAEAERAVEGLSLPRACAVRAQARQARGRPAWAVKALDALLKRDPRSAWAYCWRGELKLKLNRPAQALKDFEMAVRIHSGYGQAYFWRGETRRRLGRNSEALADLDRAVSEGAGGTLALVSRGLVRAALGDEAGGNADFAAARLQEVA